MRFRSRSLIVFIAVLLVSCALLVWAQETKTPVFRTKVDLVVLTFTVTDSKGRYVNGLKPGDFRILEDGIVEKISTFADGNKPAVQVNDDGTVRPLIGSAGDSKPGIDPRSDAFVGTNVFVLFDTSNFMYRGFVYAEDAIADFVRGLDRADSVAMYSFSRNLSRAAQLSRDRGEAIVGLRKVVAGDDTALYNALLLTLRDAAKVPGRKVVIVFSNGPDNSSVVPPEDVAELAQSSGIPIYMISTREARLEPVSTAVFERMTAATGGKAYFSKNWRDERKAFASIRDDLGHLYSLSYSPKSNPNHGWRNITVKLVGDHLKNYRVRTRNGYRPQPSRFSVGNVTEAPANGAGSN